ncbi:MULTISPECIES: GntR family transcriptional regulator [unclassified Mesorhizobium]|uniref:GntR family transcriptional regulator n=1 Tax=unclassified Mesorhizobium TaxID=325217 RepID=UPI001FE1900E|nr:GntR family transcriptional regulator [Mesorhizobium sp. M7A.F.Ca.MR.362.00.0.0]
MKERLVRGAFEPGRKLTVRAVADALGVSSIPARDALNRLATKVRSSTRGQRQSSCPI